MTTRLAHGGAQYDPDISDDEAYADPDCPRIPSCYGRSLPGRGGPARFCHCPKGQESRAKYENGMSASWAEANVPAQLEGVTMAGARAFHADFPARLPAIDAAERFVAAYRAGRTPGAGLALLGPVGTGKSGILAAAVAELRWMGVPCLWYTYAALVAGVQAQYKTALSDQRLVNAQRAQILIVDDLGDPFRVRGETQETEDRRRIALSILGERADRKRPTLISANYEDVGQLADQFDPRLADRIYQSCEIHVVPGESMRRQPKI